MNDLVEINSRDYWDKRFVNDWDENDGPKQSLRFAQLATRIMPEWLWEAIRHDTLQIADWGCAEGAGTDWFSSFVGGCKIVGIDFSCKAIEVARQRYPAASYRCENWLDEKVSEADFDVVISSNTLEHFHKPFSVLQMISLHARKAVAVLLPYREIERIDEHFFTFLAENIPFYLRNGFVLCHSRVVDCSTDTKQLWRGEQIALVYADPRWLARLQLVLKDVEIAGEDQLQRLAILNDSEKNLLSRNELLTKWFDRELDQNKELSIKLKDREAELERLVEAGAKWQQTVLRLEGQLTELRTSTIWRATRPLRKVGTYLKGLPPKGYLVAKSVFWGLPEPLRNRLHGPRHAFVRWLKQNPVMSTAAVGDTLSDISWEQFSTTVLAERESYRGIFVQEITVDWSLPLFQRPQHMAAAMARLGYLVIYRTSSAGADAVNGFREVMPNVWLTNSAEVDTLNGVVRSVYSTALFVAPDNLKKHKGDKILYEYIDHIDPQISGDSANIKKLLQLKGYAFSGGADLIVASARDLRNEAATAVGGDKVVLVPNGVDTRHYRNPNHQQVQLPADLLSWSKQFESVVGYFGALAPWLWYEELDKLIHERSDLGFLFIGPDYYGGSEKLPSTDNLKYLGPLDYEILPAFAGLFDVCLIPFAPGDIAKTTSPLKLFEYFAMEKPVVSTSFMSECVAFSEVFHGDSAKSLSIAIDHALEVASDPAYRDALRQLADKNDWDCRAEVLIDAIERPKHEGM